MTHSPLPWRVEIDTDEIGGDYYGDVIYQKSTIKDSSGEIVADNEPWYPKAVSPDDQALIVRAVNAHAELVRVLEAMQKFYEPMRFNRESDNAKSDEIDALAIATLKLARGEV